ncbi:hypothetical protein HBI56_156560 [Parastagonospora nodorum]|nr:hypothetical protein HBH56_119250 [Parastagonospora nodorum]KAH3959835.1 hypothetical protein HBH51_197640 [Parastagonospora nodorum]KAH3973896.1 hypothetical protein HBH52_141590 [Parastagonospora nodorum]KAH3998675.1 hypothetical protein HBI10_128540 [Parastagonospora nodorum]KAH4089047.1 hypothetical protein HBH48_122120 [Parastagonospora nodorum]
MCAGSELVSMMLSWLASLFPVRATPIAKPHLMRTGGFERCSACSKSALRADAFLILLPKKHPLQLLLSPVSICWHTAVCIKSTGAYSRVPARSPLAKRKSFKLSVVGLGEDPPVGG